MTHARNLKEKSQCSLLALQHKKGPLARAYIIIIIIIITIIIIIIIIITATLVFLVVVDHHLKAIPDNVYKSVRK